MSETTRTPGPDERPGQDGAGGTFVGGSFGEEEQDAQDVGGLAAPAEAPTDAPSDVPAGERDEPV